MAFDRSARPRLRAKAQLRHDRISGKNMLLYPERGLALNAVAAAMVQRLDGSHTLASIVDEVSTMFHGADPAVVEADLDELVADLAARGLLDRVG
ncbi:MAG: pyrroloquinoline quinone biosynthesis peptide chaperone PqqD [Byssovorax sp.]